MKEKRKEVKAELLSGCMGVEMGTSREHSNSIIALE
jgi:hypothetical protein